MVDENTRRQIIADFINELKEFVDQSDYHTYAHAIGQVGVKNGIAFEKSENGTDFKAIPRP